MSGSFWEAGVGIPRIQWPTNNNLHRGEDKGQILAGTTEQLDQTSCVLVLRMDKKCECNQGYNVLLLKSFLTGSFPPQPGSWKIFQLRNMASPLEGSFLFPTLSQDGTWSTSETCSLLCFLSPPCDHLCFLPPPERNNFVCCWNPTWSTGVFSASSHMHRSTRIHQL